MDHAESGDLSHLTSRAIAAAAGWVGRPERFVQALVEQGLLDEGPKIHDWDDYSGKLTDRRAKDRERKKLERDRDRQLASRGRPREASAGSPMRQDRTGQDSDSDRTTQHGSDEETTTSFATAVKDAGPKLEAIEAVRPPSGEDSVAAVEQRVERALDVLRQIASYPYKLEQDRRLLRDAAAKAPGQDLAEDVRRWREASANGTVRYPRAALKGWLARFGDRHVVHSANEKTSTPPTAGRDPRNGPPAVNPGGGPKNARLDPRRWSFLSIAAKARARQLLDAEMTPAMNMREKEAAWDAAAERAAMEFGEVPP
jgi:hypothetical protein